MERHRVEISPPADQYVRGIFQFQEIHDGDTYRFLVDLGFSEFHSAWVRLKGLDTWELSQPGGFEARDGVGAFLRGAKKITIQTFRTSGGEDKMSFIRYVADIWVDGIFLVDWIKVNHPEYVKTLGKRS